MGWVQLIDMISGGPMQMTERSLLGTKWPWGSTDYNEIHGQKESIVRAECGKIDIAAA
jgi:hypothetical protein